MHATQDLLGGGSGTGRLAKIGTAGHGLGGGDQLLCATAWGCRSRGHAVPCRCCAPWAKGPRETRTVSLHVPLSLILGLAREPPAGRAFGMATLNRMS